MSVCLATTKSVAVVAAGLHAGVCFGGLLSPESCAPSCEGQPSSGSYNCAREVTLGVLGTLATGFFGASYFGAPQKWKHPYLLYTTALALITTGATAVKLLRHSLLPRYCRSKSRGKHVTEKSKSDVCEKECKEVCDEPCKDKTGAAGAVAGANAGCPCDADSEHSQDESVVLVSDSNSNSESKNGCPCPTSAKNTESCCSSKRKIKSCGSKQSCCSVVSTVTSDCVLDTVRTVSSVALLILGVVGGLGEPLAPL